MIGNVNGLYFPKLTYEKNIILQNNIAKTVSVYSIDWSKKPDYRDIKFANTPTFSSLYDELLLNNRYAISTTYLKEIRRYSWNALYEFNNTKKMEYQSHIKEYCYNAVYEMIDITFKLISDSLCNDACTYFERNPIKKEMIHLILILKFWHGQISFEMLKHRINISPELLKHTEYSEFINNIYDWMDIKL